MDNDKSAQEIIRARSEHPSGVFVPFARQDIRRSVPESFEATVRLYPKRVALKARNYVVTYDELNRSANRLARFVLTRHKDSSHPIAVLLENGASVIEAVFAVLKIGHSFVVLDPAHPSSRLRYILDDAGVRVVITDTRHLALATEAADQRLVLNLDETDERLSDDNLGRTISPDAIASLNYTSGSTGEPKGVIWTHANELHGAMRHINTFSVCHADRLNYLRSLSSAGGTGQVWRALLSGAALHLFNVKEEGLSNLATWVLEEEITFLNLGVSTFRTFIETLTGKEENFPSVRLLRLSSDCVTRSDAELYRKHFSPDCAVVNSLTSTESRLVSAYYMDKQTSVDDYGIPIGYPVTDVKIFLQDREEEEDGFAVGEIAIKSRYLGGGYWNQPELTEAKFLADPDGSDSKIYLTGDLGRMAPDGRLVHLGRKDFKVKVRGYSVGLAEIEQRLVEHPEIREAVVVAQELESGDKRLIAYVVASDKSPLNITSLRGFLAERLAEYMLPAAFVTMEVLPRDVVGKVQRRMLPAPTGDRPDLAGAFVAPRNATEEQLAAIWATLFGLKEVGVRDSFFELGGHSLIASRLLARVRHTFAVTLTLRTLFESVTVEALSQRIENARSASDEVMAPPILPKLRNHPAPLSFAQQRLWFLDQLEPDNSFWNLPGSLRLTGSLDVAVLAASLHEITRRQESLRTTFAQIDGEAVQVIHQDMPLILHRVDLKGLEQEVRDSEVDRVVHDDAHRPFELAEGPLCRVKLLEIAAQQNVLFYNLHHIISDGWSGGNLMRELAALMKSFGEGRASPLEELPVQYADYAVWEREWLQGEVLEQHLAFWHEHLSGAPPFLELPADRPRPRAETFRGERYPWDLSVELSEKLRELSRSEGTTVFMTLLAAVNLLLYRLTGQRDLVVGMVSANRTRVEIERLIGFFVNVLPLRTTVVGEISFSELLAVIRRNCLEASEHQWVPFEKIVEDQRPIRDLSHAPVFQVVFDMANPRASIELPGVRVERLQRRFGPAKYDLVLHATEEDERVAFALDYSTELFDGDRIEAMLRQLEQLLEEIVADPGRGIEAYSLVDSRSCALLPDPTARLDDSCVGAIHRLFSEQAARVPEQIAVSDIEDEWTYGELERRSHQLAHKLKAQGVGKGDVVAILGQRSGSLVWALLGVLKAGAAFTILDPSHPVARLEEYVRVAKPRGWVELEAGGERAEALAAVTEGIGCLIRLPRLGAVGESFDEYPITDPGIEVGADDLAYVAFTSGSTGEPRGVLGRHGPLTHFMPAQQATYGLSATDRFILLSGLAYNLLHRDVFTPLALGVALYIPETVNSPEEVLASIASNEVTVLHLTPALGQMLAETAGETQLSSVRYSFLAGDTLTGQGVERLHKLLPNAQVINRYGATETQRATSECIVGQLGGAIPPQAKKQAVPLGRGIADVQMLVLNEVKGLAGVGELGELFVRSPHLAAGYLDDAELTMERFVVNPFTADEQDRMYRTGEWARYLPDGQVQFVSRGKGSVNIRGYRIELTEIEGILQQHEAVGQAVVVAKNFGEEGSGDERLVAYVSLRESGGRVDVRELRSYVRARLPEHMVPGYVEFLAAIPLTSNGKVNQEALPEPDRTRAEFESSYMGPRTETEEVLTGIWVELLHLDRVGIHDNFFELGGHSLLATQVLQRMRDALQIELRLRSLFESPTVAELAELIDTTRWAVQTPADQSGESLEEERF